MEASEKVVESYFRFVKGYFTIPNLRCKGQKEVDLKGMRYNNGSIERIDVEVSMTTSGGFAKLNAKPYSHELKKTRSGSPSESVKIGYFIEEKFNHSDVIATLKDYGFEEDNYQKILVFWDWEADVESIADKYAIRLVRFNDILHEMQDKFGKETAYYSDDTVRLLQLLKKSEMKK